MTSLQVCNTANEIILNTPNRNEILEAGPPRNAKCNILGRGAYGTVFKAIFKAQPVAVKVIKNLKDSQFETMRNEANILGWKHPNVIQILEVESTMKFGLVIMERFVGHCLQLVLDSIELPLIHRVCISLDILRALNYCHKRRLVHLDVKPQNVLVSFQAASMGVNDKSQRKYICKLCDFGSSLKFDDRKENAGKFAIKGTVRYMSPEALRQESLSPASDIYSLGVTMWQLKHRRLPYFCIDSNESVAYQVVKYDLRPDSKMLSTPKASGPSHNTKAKSHCDCLCENFSSDPSEHSLEYVKSALHHMKQEDNFKLNTEGIYAGNNKVRGLGVRRILQDLNSSTNSKCDVRSKLNSQFQYNEIFNPLHGITAIKASYLAGVFRSNKKKAFLGREPDYVDIYKSCWNGDFKCRPNSAALYKRLRQFL